MVWKPHVTVAALCERENRFLLVEERIDGRRCLNQPAGHLEPGESLCEAVVRETREETGWVFAPQALVGIYRWRAPDGKTFVRFTFTGAALRHFPDESLDEEIEQVLWLTPAQIQARDATLRSPLVLLSVEDYLSGSRYPLSLLQDLPDGAAP